jgi:hypothetical protein
MSKRSFDLFVTATTDAGCLIAQGSLGHVWGMSQGTSGDNSGIERTVVIRLQPATKPGSSSVRQAMPCMAYKNSLVGLFRQRGEVRMQGVAATNTGTTTAWFTLIGALGGVLLTTLGGLLRTSLDFRSQRRLKELDLRGIEQVARRDEKRNAYIEFLTGTDAAYQLAADLLTKARKGEALSFRDESRDVVSQLMQRELTVALVAGPTVRMAARDYVTVLRQLMIDAAKADWRDETKDVRNQLMQAMIQDLNPESHAPVPRSIDPISP